MVIGPMGGGLGTLPASPLAARLGWRRVLLLSDLVGGVAVAVQFVFPTPPVIIVTTLGVGASVALFLVVNAPFLAANSTPTERIALFGLSTALGYLAAVAGSLLGGFLPGWMSHTPLFPPLPPLLAPTTQPPRSPSPRDALSCQPRGTAARGIGGPGRRAPGAAGPGGAGVGALGGAIARAARRGIGGGGRGGVCPGGGGFPAAVGRLGGVPGAQ